MNRRNFLKRVILIPSILSGLAISLKAARKQTYNSPIYSIDPASGKDFGAVCICRVEKGRGLFVEKVIPIEDCKDHFKKGRLVLFSRGHS